MSIFRNGREHGAPDVVEAHMSAEDAADSLRTQSFHLMEANPIAAAHLVLAAASIAPTCDDERMVAEEFSYVIGDFALELVALHKHAVMRRARTAGGSINGH